MLDGAIDPKALSKLARERGFPAIAICDRNGLYGAPAFAKACLEEGIQPIIGALVGVVSPFGDGHFDNIPLYAQNERGYQNLCHIVSKAHLDRPVDLPPHVSLDSIYGYTDGLIAFTGAGQGSLSRLLAEGQTTHASLCLKN